MVFGVGLRRSWTGALAVLAGVMALCAAPTFAHATDTYSYVTTDVPQVFKASPPGYDNSQAGFYNQVFWIPNEPVHGSFSKTCVKNGMRDSNSANLNTVAMNRKCQKEDGSWRNSSLIAYEYCLTDIFNDNGQLRCSVPHGSYLATCRNAAMTNGAHDPSNLKPGANVLSAECKGYDGAYHATTLNAQMASVGCLFQDVSTTWGTFYFAGGDIANVNGVLACILPPPPPPPQACSSNGVTYACAVPGGNHGVSGSCAGANGSCTANN